MAQRGEYTDPGSPSKSEAARGPQPRTPGSVPLSRSLPPPCNGPGGSAKVTEVRPTPALGPDPKACSMVTRVATGWHCGVTASWQPPQEAQSSGDCPKDLRGGKTGSQRAFCAALISDKETKAQRGTGSLPKSHS